MAAASHDVDEDCTPIEVRNLDSDIRVFLIHIACGTSNTKSIIAVPSSAEVSMYIGSIDVHAFCPELFLRLLNLCHQLFVCLWDVFKREDTPAQVKKKMCAEPHEGPKWQLHDGCKHIFS